MSSIEVEWWHFFSWSVGQCLSSGRMLFGRRRWAGARPSCFPYWGRSAASVCAHSAPRCLNIRYLAAYYERCGMWGSWNRVEIWLLWKSCVMCERMFMDGVWLIALDFNEDGLAALALIARRMNYRDCWPMWIIHHHYSLMCFCFTCHLWVGEYLKLLLDNLNICWGIHWVIIVIMMVAPAQRILVVFV